jgi:nucleoside-diphosphate-sugar epimerase
LVRQAKTSGSVRYIGRGLNRWSNVHIADVVALYRLALAKAPAGTFMYVKRRGKLGRDRRRHRRPA